MVETREYTCARCGGAFVTDVPVEAVLAEEREVFGFNATDETRRSLCDPCYQEFRGWLDAMTPEERAEMDRQAQLDEANNG